MGLGLGGSSADAAGVLNGLATLYADRLLGLVAAFGIRRGKTPVTLCRAYALRGSKQQYIQPEFAINRLND